MVKNTAKRMWTALFYAVCLVAALSFVGYHLYELINSDIVTVRAENRHFEETSSYTAYIARDEKTVSFSDGSVRFLGKNGTRFKVGDDCAYIYSADKQPILDRIEELKYENSILSSALYYTTLNQSSADADIYYTELMKSLSSGNFAISGYSDKLFASQLSKDYVFDRDAIREAYDKNQKAIDELISSLGAYTEKVKMPFTGCFFENADGFGDVFSASLAETGTAGEILSAIGEYTARGAKESGNMFAVTRFSEWYIIIPTSAQDSEKYQKGIKYTLLLGEKEIESAAYLEDVRTTDDGKEACLIFSLSSLAAGFDYSREFEIKVVTEEYDGYRIPLSALRSAKDGTSGVFVMSGGVVLFRRVEIISTTDTYALVKTYDNYIYDLQKSRTANKIYNSKNDSSLFAGIYPGGAQTVFENKEDIFDNRKNKLLTVKNTDGDTVVDLNVDVEDHEYGYLEENEFIIIEGSSLYHGKIPG